MGLKDKIFQILIPMEEYWSSRVARALSPEEDLPGLRAD